MVGTNAPTSIRVGTNNVLFARVGTNLVWQSFSPLTLGPVAWYKGDGNALDMAGGYNGAWLGTETYTNGINSQAFSIQAQARSVTVSNAVFEVDGIKPFSLCFWVKPNFGARPSTYYGMMLYRAASSSGYYIFDNGTSVSFRRGTGSTYAGPTLSGLQDGVWQHFAATYDGATFTAYRNAGSAASQSRPETNTVTKTTLYIGRALAGGSESRFAGDIDDVLIFNRALTPDEITRLYQWRQ